MLFPHLAFWVQGDNQDDSGSCIWKLAESQSAWSPVWSHWPWRCSLCLFDPPAGYFFFPPRRLFLTEALCFVCAWVSSDRCSYVPVGPSWAFQSDTSCLQGSQVPIMAGGSGPGRPTQASGISSRLDSPLPFPQDKLTCLGTQEPASP